MPDSTLLSSSGKSNISTDTDQQSRITISTPITPTTPPTNESSYPLARNSTPESPCPTRGRAKSPLETLATRAPRPNCEGTEIQVKLESSDNEPGWPFRDPPKVIPQYSQYIPLQTAYTGGDKLAPLRRSGRLLNRTDYGSTQARTTTQGSHFKTDDNDAAPAAAEESEQQPRKLVKERNNIKLPLSNLSSSRSGPEHKADKVEVVAKGNVSLTAQTSNFITGGKSVSVRKSSTSSDILAKATVSNMTLAQILPFNTRERVIVSPGLCAASLVKNIDQQCPNRAKGPVREVTKLLERLSEPNLNTNNTEISSQLTQLIKSALCGIHINSAMDRLQQVEELFHQLSKCEKGNSSSKNPFIVDLTSIAFWINALTTARPSTDSLPGETSRQETISTTQTPSSAKNQTETPESSSPTPAPATFRKTRSSRVNTGQPQRAQQVDCTQNFVPYRPKSTAHLSTSELLRSILTKPLTARDSHMGNIYAYCLPPNFGCIKIGFASGEPRARIEQWERQCKHKAESLIPEDQQHEFEVQNAYRVEALVHAELRDVRQKEVNCKVCGRTHREWFATDREHVLRVIKKFVDAMKRDLYEPVYIAGEYVGELKESISSAEIDELCTPLELTPSSRNDINVNGQRQVSSARSRNARVSRGHK
ncbi:DUF1766-domain-containing protein [Cenococcum geophilum 1.58]|uniref:DUF1766-domain-containing protein n=1 Tax=Cenococcum geophilum 1.58 TaxID=794803 RepID=UPI00358EDFD9|nr:DUF1766-domain-containing protein [Cenococcum geophilum 1.58]